MKITAPEEYGLRCLLQLARTRTPYGLNIRQIAEAENLSIPYAAKLLRVLRKAELIASVLGMNGGYQLARPATEIRLGEVMRILGGSIFDDPGYCERHASPDGDDVCVHHDDCTLRMVWQALEGWMRRLLDQMTLADLLQSPESIADRLRRLPNDTEALELPGGLLTLGSVPRG